MPVSIFTSRSAAHLQTARTSTVQVSNKIPPVVLVSGSSAASLRRQCTVPKAFNCTVLRCAALVLHASRNINAQHTHMPPAGLTRSRSSTSRSSSSSCVALRGVALRFVSGDGTGLDWTGLNASRVIEEHNARLNSSIKINATLVK